MRESIRFLFVVVSVFLIGIFYCCAQETAIASDKEEKSPSSAKKPSALTWLKYDEGLAKAEKEKKHVLIAFYTNWCGWCRRMDNSTYTDEEVKKVLDESYVAIKVNAQSKEKVEFDEKKITETELARKYWVRSYPTTWFLKHSGEKIAPYYGYADAQSFVSVLNFIKDDLYDKMSFEEYLKKQDKEKDTSGK